MTEAEWRACADPYPMLDFLAGRLSDRRLRLYAVACCRHIWPLLTDERNRRAVEVAERFADRQADWRALNAASAAAHDAFHEAEGPTTFTDTRGRVPAYDEETAREAAGAASAAAVKCVQPIRGPSFGRYVTSACAVAVGWKAAVENPVTYEAAFRAESAAQAVLLREIFGSPFRPVRVDPDWFTWNGGTVAQLAQVIYDERRWADLPVLADALEEAGCTDTGLLEHCRRPGEHVRGCWAVDLCLGQE
jgi:hypothetical protein